MKIELLKDIPVADIHKCTKGKTYENVKIIPLRGQEKGIAGSAIVLAESGEEVTILHNEYKILEYDNER